MHIGWSQRLIAVVALVCSANASALGFGSVRSSVVLGQPLNIAVPVTLAEGETLSADCASAEVVSGENRLPPGSVRVRVTQGRDASESVLRITTTTAIDEPVINVTLNAGCPTRLSRTLVLLADPPTVITASAETPSLPVTVTASAARPAAAAPAGGANATSEGAGRREARTPAPARAPRTARVAPRPAAVAAPMPRPAPVVVAATPAALSASAAPSAAPAAASRPSPRAEGRARLQLDSGQVSAAAPAAVLAAQEQALAARASANAAEAAASAANDRMRTMEAELGRVRQEAKAQTDALVQLRQQLALDRAQREQPALLTNVLAGVAALLLVLVAWMFLRLRKQSRAEQTRADWWDREATAVGASALESTNSSFAPSSTSVPLRAQQIAAAAPQRVPSAPAPWSDAVDSRNSEVDLLISPLTVPAPTAVTIPSLPAPAPHVEEAERAMSVDEQIDLEQQADFFIALGHDDAAIDLLMAHMRSTGGASPLPFLKLLEIHRRRNQREAYERTRVRFNQRFNSVAPEWQADPKLGRKLEEYQLAIGRIQRVWPAPLDAMAELEALLFRRGGGAELFDLPAYQEVLFLYQMARDLHQADGAGSGSDVDVLLPIGGRSQPMAAPEGTIVLRPEFNAGEPMALALDKAGLPPLAEPADDRDLDLDLSTRPGDSSALAPVDSLSLEHRDDAQEPPREDDFWGNNPDARPTR